ncbi:MAG: NADH-quinone oxidoreductase subunit NuoE [Salinisphaeraceae bacterium]|nr:NADH-quinone oxidoreductase subunit NuoE [Salinisphaeraceae bacterium]
MTDAFVLSDNIREAIEREAAHYPDRQAASIEALKIVQEEQGWVSDAALKATAELLGMSAEALDSVATFYNLIYRKPVGRHVIFVCDSVSCWVTGYEGLRSILTKKLGIELGQTTADGRFTLLPICCLGACDRAPAILIDGNLHGRVKPDQLDAVLEAYP